MIRSIPDYGNLDPGGVLAFVEQDLMTDSMNHTSGVFLKVAEKEQRTFKGNQALGLREVLKRAGLRLLPRRSFLWTDDHYGPYTHELLGRFIEAGLSKGRIANEEAERFRESLERKAEAGDFYYGLVYHRIAGALD